MKKIFILIFLLPFICNSQNPITTIDFVDGALGSGTACGPGSICQFGTTGRTVSNILIYQTHGCSQVQGQVYPDNTRRLILGNDGIAIAYNFKGNYKYIITIYGSLAGGTLQMRLTNSPIYANICKLLPPSIDISQPNDPTIFGSITDANFYLGKTTIEFTPGQCFSYLWLSEFIGSAGTSIYKITIEESNVLSISGTIPICSVNSFVLNTNGHPYSGNVSWQSSNTAIATVSPSGNPATVTRIGNGLVTLTAAVAGCTSNQNTTMQVAVGKVTPSPIRTGPSTIIDIEVYLSPEVLGATSYNWYKNGVVVSNQHRADADILLTCGVNTQIGVEAINSCGTSTRVFRTVNVSCNGPGGFLVAPNPATNQVTVSSAADVKNDSKAIRTFDLVNIYDFQGNLVKKQNFLKVSQGTIDLTGLKDGVYFFEIVDGIQKEKQKVIISHNQ
jgi:hypothetical protein